MLHSIRLRTTTSLLLIAVCFAIIGALTFVITAVATGGNYAPAWQSRGVSGILLWAYERGSITTIVVLFMLALACGLTTLRHSLLAAISLSLFYPAFALIRVSLGLHTGNLMPFELLGYLFFVVLCVVGYFFGRLLRKAIPRPKVERN